jgi:hypothetical protein
MTPQEFLMNAEKELALVPANEFAAKRALWITKARSEFGSSIAREIADAIPDNASQLHQAVAPPPGINIPGFVMRFH